MPKLLKLKRSRPRQRLLRSYCRIAQEEHHCCNCPYGISPGEEYKAEVWIYGRRLQVWKQHIECDHPHWEDDDEEFDEREDERAEAEAAAQERAA